MAKWAEPRYYGSLDDATGLLIDDGYVKADELRLALGCKDTRFRVLCDASGVARVVRRERGRCFWIDVADARRLLDQHGGAWW